MMTAKRTARVVLGVLVLAGVAICQKKSIVVHEPARRLALVIGNAAYANSPLENPEGDAELIGATLEGLGFDEVVLETNLKTLPALRGAVRAFGRGLRANDLAFFYYSGHGLQAPGGDRGETQNYLLPTGFDWETRLEEVEDKALSFEQVKRILRDKAQLRVLVLDACRTYKRGKGEGGAGLAPTLAARGELIAYATEPNALATDEGAGAGIFAQELAGALRQPGVEVVDVFRNVMEGVEARTEGAQHPEIMPKINGRLYLNGRSVDSAKPWIREWQALEGIESPAMRGSVAAYIKNYKDESEARDEVAKAEKLLAKLEGMVGENKARVAGQVWRSPQGMEFVWIPAGTFVMGSPEDEAGRGGDEQQHEVTISQGFWMGKYEVTQGEWQAVMGANPSVFKACGARCPVETVSWFDVQGFIQKLNENERESGSANRYRLPSEAEWEYAARAESAGATPEGDLRILGLHNAPVLDRQAWYGGNSGVSYEGARDCSEFKETQNEAGLCGTHPVGLKRENAWGLYDMLGNVVEWTGDWYGEYASGAVTDPRGPSTGDYWVSRGGSFVSTARQVRSAFRLATTIHSGHDLGFRVVRTK